MEVGFDEMQRRRRDSMPPALTGSTGETVFSFNSSAVQITGRATFNDALRNLCARKKILINKDGHCLVSRLLIDSEKPEAKAALFLELPKPCDRYSYPLYLAELRRDIRWGIFGDMSEHQWEVALAREEIVISSSGAFVTVNATFRR